MICIVICDLLREKAKAQKLKNAAKVSPPKKTAVVVNSPQSQSPSPSKPKPKVNLTPITNNFPEETIDAIEYMEITRRNKLRKRKKKVENKFKIDTSSTANRRLNKPSYSKEPDILSSTPILSAVEGKHAPKIEMSARRARLAFRLNNEIELQNYFSYDDKLMDVMMYIINETSLTDFTFISQYPPLNIDSIYLDRKMEEQGRSLFGSGSGDEKSNESQYDEVQKTLQKTLYELNLVPSCRIFIRSKYKGIIIHYSIFYFSLFLVLNYVIGSGHKVEDGEGNVIGKILNGILELLRIGGDGIYQLIVLILGLVWAILKIPLGLLGIVKDDGMNQRQSYPAQSQSGSGSGSGSG